MSDVPVCVLDISVLLYTPEALYHFPDKEVVIPVCILEELDCIKMDLGEKVVQHKLSHGCWMNAGN